MPFDDFRSFLRALAAEGELVEAAALPGHEPPADVNHAATATEAPATLVATVEGRIGRLAVGVHGSLPRLALALGLPRSLELDDLVASALGRLGEAVQADYVAPSAAACKQVVLRGAAADVTRFPLLQPPGQPGLALDKALLVTRDPATGAVGISLAELRVIAPRQLAVRPRLGGALERHVAALAAGVPLEVAAIVGNDPVLPLVAASNVPPADDAYLYASALRGSPLLITDCESTELEIPARTEIVLEGLAEVDSRQSDGVSLAIHTITHRRDPVYEALRGGWAGDEARLLEQWAAAIRTRDPDGAARAAVLGGSL